MRTTYQQAAAPKTRTATSKEVRPKVSENATGRNAVLRVANKGTEDYSTKQLSLFGDLENPPSDTNEMELFFDSVRPHLEGLKASDRLSVLSGIYWLKAGEDMETLSALLRKPIRPVFEHITKEVLL